MNFLKILGFFSMIISSAKAFFNNYIRPAIATVQTIKKIIDNPELDILVELTKTHTDDAVLQKVRQALAFAITELNLFADCLDKPTVGEQIICFINYIKNLPAALQDSIFHKTAGLIAANLATIDNVAPLQNHQIDTLVQVAYAADKAKQPAPVESQATNTDNKPA